MEILDNLPDDVHWNVIKYLEHPTAKLIKESYLEHVQSWCHLRHFYNTDPTKGFVLGFDGRDEDYWRRFDAKVLREGLAMLANDQNHHKFYVEYYFN